MSDRNVARIHIKPCSKDMLFNTQFVRRSIADVLKKAGYTVVGDTEVHPPSSIQEFKNQVGNGFVMDVVMEEE